MRNSDLDITIEACLQSQGIRNYRIPDFTARLRNIFSARSHSIKYQSWHISYPYFHHNVQSRSRIRIFRCITACFILSFKLIEKLKTSRNAVITIYFHRTVGCQNVKRCLFEKEEDDGSSVVPLALGVKDEQFPCSHHSNPGGNNSCPILPISF